MTSKLTQLLFVADHDIVSAVTVSE